jgi:hypothetical protein
MYKLFVLFFFFFRSAFNFKGLCICLAPAESPDLIMIRRRFPSPMPRKPGSGLSDAKRPAPMAPASKPSLVPSPGLVIRMTFTVRSPGPSGKSAPRWCRRPRPTTANQNIKAASKFNIETAFFMSLSRLRRSSPLVFLCLIIRGIIQPPAAACR